jgi:hypothetical protein
MKFDIWGVFENLPRKFEFHWNRTRIKDTLHEDQYIFIISRSFRLRMRNVSDKNWRENKNTHFVSRNFFFFRKSFHVWDNVEKYCRAVQATDDYGACALHAEYQRLQTHTHKTHTQVVYYSLLFHCNTGCTNAPQCYMCVHSLSWLKTASANWSACRAKHICDCDRK